MAKRTVSYTSITPTATADAATVLADNTYPFLIQGGSTTQRVVIYEIMVSGQAGSSAPTFMLLARDVVVAATNSLNASQNDAPNDPATAALAAPTLVGNTNTTKPQRSTTLKLGNFSLNAFGGIIRHSAAPGQEWSVVGNAVNLGEVSFSAFTGGTPGPIGCHCIYEAT